MVLYTIKCYTYFTAPDRKKRTSNLNKQIFYIFMIHFMCHIMLLINIEDVKAYMSKVDKTDDIQDLYKMVKDDEDKCAEADPAFKDFLNRLK